VTGDGVRQLAPAGRLRIGPAKKGRKLALLNKAHRGRRREKEKKKKTKASKRKELKSKKTSSPLNPRSLRGGLRRRRAILRPREQQKGLLRGEETISAVESSVKVMRNERVNYQGRERGEGRLGALMDVLTQACLEGVAKC